MDGADHSPRYFAVVEPRVWTENRFYRLYVTPEELVGVWVGRANDIARAFVAQGGLVGGLLAGAATAWKKGSSRAEELETKPFEELRADHKHNFAIRVEDVEAAEVAPASLGFRLNYASVPQVGLLRLRTAGRKRLTLAIPSNEDMREALDLLAARLGDRLRVGLAWDERRKKYRRA